MAQAASSTAQLNVRMDGRLKAAADEVLARVGVSPAEVVRALWARIACGVQDCETLLEVIAQGTSQAQVASAAASAEGLGPGDAFLQGLEARQAAVFAMGGPGREHYRPMTDEQLDEALWEEWCVREGRAA